jgi:RNase H-like domain found in reverse transcriptase/Reverse transcriptase (RNA-dependent DNA polymerase)
VFTKCASLSSATRVKDKYANALLHDRMAHYDRIASSSSIPPCTIDTCAQQHEVCINAALSYRSNLIRIRGKHKGSHLTILLDDGAAINIISRRKVQELGLHTLLLDQPITVSQFQGQTVANCTHAVFMPISVIASTGKTHVIQSAVPYIVMDLESNFDIIMGMPIHEQFDLDKQYRSKITSFNPPGAQSFAVHSYEKHIFNTQPATVISHLSANYLLNTKQISDTFTVWVNLPSLQHVCSVQAQPDPSHASPQDHTSTQPGGAPQPAAPHQPAVGPHLSPSDQAKVREVLHPYAHVFTEPSGINPHLPPFQIHQKHDVPCKPFIRFARRLTLEERETVQLTIQKFLDKGWIQPSSSAWGAPIMFIRKADGGLRAVVDYRQLNSQSSSDGVKLPLLSECLQQMAGKQFYSKLDLADGYFQVPMHTDSVHKTAFTTGDGRQFEWLVMPMGLKGAPNHFCRMMHNTLKHLIDAKVCAVYLDDILIASNSMHEHLQHIQQVLDALSSVDLRAKPSKCQFAFASVDFLGHHVGPSGIGTQPSKVEAITSYPIPSSASQLDSFLGLVGFYSPLIHNLSAKCSFLRHKVLHWNASCWTQSHQSAYDAIKQAVASAPFMHAVDPHLPFHIHLDASKVGAGATLSQNFGKGLQPVAYFSRKLLDYQRKYQNGKRELLALMLACRQWRHWVGGAGVCVHAYTDHSNNALLFSPTFSVNDTIVAGWVLELQQEYPGLTITHIPGSHNSAADALSRNPDFLTDTTPSTTSSSLYSSDSWGLIGCVLGFQGNTLEPVFDTVHSPQSSSHMYTSNHSLHDAQDSNSLIHPIFAFTGAALILNPNTDLQHKFTAAYPTDAFLQAHK